MSGIMNPKRKTIFLIYLMSNECKCGRTKQAGQWLCQTCWNIHQSTQDWDKIRHACTDHLELVQIVLDKIKKE